VRFQTGIVRPDGLHCPVVPLIIDVAIKNAAETYACRVHCATCETLAVLSLLFAVSMERAEIMCLLTRKSIFYSKSFFYINENYFVIFTDSV